MDFIDDQRKSEVEILSVESIPCDLVGMSAVFNKNGARLSDPWKFPWPMDWVEEELSKAVKENSYISQTVILTAFNQEEPDQIIKFRLRSYIDLLLGDIPEIVASHFPERMSYINSSGSRKYTYESFSKNVDRVAGGLIAIGVGKGDVTATWAVNSPEYGIAQFGIAKAGSIMAPLNAYEKEHYMESVLNKSDAKTLILQVGTKATENIETLYRICPELCESMPGNLRSERIPKLRNVIVKSDQEYPGTYRWSDILAMGTAIDKEKISERRESLSTRDPVHMIFTSGTTGFPKGVMLTHGNLVEISHSIKKTLELVPEDVICIQAPMFHCFGCIVGSLAGVVSGSSMVMVDKYKSEITLSLIKRENCTVVSGVPVMFDGMAKILSSESFDGEELSIRTGIIAGAPGGGDLFRDIKDILKIEKPFLSYGLTEASPSVTFLSLTDKNQISGGNVGKPIEGVQVRIVDMNDKTPIADKNVKGEIAVYGYNIMQGYYNDPDETDKALSPDGWLYTGDIGYMDDSGDLFIADRIKDIIIRNGENISPREIEGVIEQYPGVDRVVVVGAKYAQCNEELVAFIKPYKDANISEEDIKEYLKGRIAKYKIPRFISFVDEFPMSDTGKIQKQELRNRAMQLSENIIN